MARAQLLLALIGSAIALSTAEPNMGEVMLGDTLAKGMAEGTSLVSRMEALSHRAEEAMKDNDSSQMLPRKGATTSIHKTFHPSPGAEVTVDVEFGNPQGAPMKGKGIFAVLQQRMQRMRKRMSNKIRHWHMPAFVRRMRKRMGHRNRFHHTMRMRKMWMRSTLGKECKTELKMCPHFPCPMRVAKCLRRRHASKLGKGCSSFVNKMKELRDGRKAAKKAFRLAWRNCHRDNKKRRHRRHRCIRKARKAKFAKIHGLFSKLQAASQQHKPQMLEQMLSQARNLFDVRMKRIKEFKHTMMKKIDGLRTANVLENQKKVDEYVNDPAIMAKKGWTAKIAKLKARWFYEHPAAFKKMQKDDEKMSVATKKEKKASELSEAKDSKKTTDMNESTPDFLTGDIEAPKGEKDMGGWTMRVYTTEQQHRLHLDEMGKPVPASSSEADTKKDVTKKDIDEYVNDPDIMAKKGWTAKIAKLKAAYFYSHHEAFKKMQKADDKIPLRQKSSVLNLCVAMLCCGFVLLILILCIRRKRKAALGNIYNELSVEQV